MLKSLNFPFSDLHGEGNSNLLQYSCLENPMDGGAWWAAVYGVEEELDTTEQLHFHFSLSCIGEGSGNPLQCSCLENSRDGGAWWAAVCGVAQSQTRLKRFSSNSSSSSSLPFGEGTGSPLQYSSLGIPKDRRAWHLLRTMWLNKHNCKDSYLYLLGL